jgi:hypothetical protein
VTFFDAGGTVAGSLTYSAASAGFQQQSTGSALPAGLPVGRAQISVTRGRAAGYTVGVDNITGDTSIYSFEELPAGVQDVVVSGVARLTGRNNTFFRTDARFYNPTPEDVVVTALFHSIGASNPAPQSATITVPAGRVIESVDILDSILHLPVGSGGAVRFTSPQPVAILSRTSNVDPAGVQPGTFGAQQKPVLLASYFSSADAGAVVTAIRQDASFRTNIGFAAGPDGAAYNLTLRNAQGGVVAVTTGTLGAFGWAQPSVADLFPGTTIPPDATLLVQVTSGTVDVYDASLDNASGDLVVTPIAPLPVALPSTASIGPAGGSIQSADGRLTLKVPAGALTAPVSLSISPTANGAPNAIGSAYALSPVGVSFSRPAQLVLAYSDAELAGTGAGLLGIAVHEGTTWYGILGGAVDTAAGTLLVPVSSTGPAPAVAAGGRVPQRAAQSGNFAPYGSVIIDPLEATVLEDDTRNLETDFVGPGAAQLAQPSVVQYPLNVPPSAVEVTWSVNGFYQGNFGGGGTISPSGNGVSATYTAPHCAPRNLVEISAKVVISLSGSPAAWTVARARIRVIPAVWAIDIFYRNKSSCGGVAAWSFDFCRSHEFGLFRLRDNQVVIFTPGVEHDARTERTPWCPGFQGCEEPRLTTPTDLELTNLTGQETRRLTIHYADLKTYMEFNPVPGADEEMEVVLRPVDCQGVAAPGPSSCN